MKLILILWAFCLIKENFGVKNYTGYKVFKVEISNEEQSITLQLLKATETKVNFLTKIQPIKPIHVLVEPSFIDRFKEIMDIPDICYTVVDENYQTTINKERTQARSARADGTISFTEFNRYEDIEAYLRKLEKNNKVASVISIGESTEGRNLSMVQLCSNGCGNQPGILIDCGIHAREWLSPAMCLYIIQEVAENYENKHMLENTDWYIIPLLNPDGYEFTHTDDRMWRKTRSKRGDCFGVDPNRNFDVKWNTSGTSGDECSALYPGPNSFSEPETIALRDFVLGAELIKLYVSFHSYGPYILFPWGYTKDLADNDDELTALAHKVADAIEEVSGTKYTYGSSANLLYLAAGGSDDWTKAVGDVKMVYTIELPPGGNLGFNAPSEDIFLVVYETFEGVRVLQKYIVDNFG